jgi:hypothetical protein
MLNDKASSQDTIGAMLTRAASADGHAKAGGVFSIECRDSEGNLKWSEALHNLVVNVGLQDMNSKYFKGSGYTAAWFLGLVTGPGSGTTFAAGDTLASHAGWTENTAYTTSGGAGIRAAVTFGTATTADPSVLNNSASPSVFTMTSNAQTIAGAFLASVSSGTSGILFSAGDFTGGDKVVDSGDSLSVTYQFSLDAA